MVVCKGIMGKQMANTAEGEYKDGVVQRQIAVLQAKTKKTFEEGMGHATRAAALAKKKTMDVVSDRGAKVAVVSAVGGGAVVGTGGVATGFVVGGALGAAVGILPALFTFGLSIPLCGALGAGCGVVVGGVAGGATGAAGAGAIGYGAYAKRAEIRRLIKTMTERIAQIPSNAEFLVENIYLLIAANFENLKERGIEWRSRIVSSAFDAKTKAARIVSDKDVQATAASAAGGAVVLGSGGAATGLVAGGAIGALVGVVPAIFTLGLSIPVFAVVGSGVGAAAGTALGSTTGVVAGAGGYRVYTKRASIRKSVDDISEQAFRTVKGLKARFVPRAQ